MKRTIYEMMYARLMDLIPTGFTEHTRIDNESFMPLHIEWIGGNKEKGYYDVSLAHYYEQEGDLMRDPEMTVRIWDHGMAEALSFQQDGILASYHEVYKYDENGELLGVYPIIKRETNMFLNQWLRNLEQQGFYIFKDKVTC